jgi:rhodanese-related sulfurtransferase
MFWLVLFLVVVGGWDLGWYAAGVRPIFPWQLKQQLAGSPDGLRLIDVRTSAEYRLFHIPGAESRPDLLLHPGSFSSGNRRKPVVVICMTGHRSPVVAHQLRRLGADRVYNLTWGMVGWKLFGGKTLEGRPPGGG